MSVSMKVDVTPLLTQIAGRRMNSGGEIKPESCARPPVDGRDQAPGRCLQLNWAIVFPARADTPRDVGEKRDRGSGRASL